MSRDRKRRKELAEGDAYHARKMRELGMSVKDTADYFDVSVATLCRGLAKLRERMGPEQFQDRRQIARARSRTHEAQAVDSSTVA